LAVEVGPGVKDAGGQVAMVHQLDLGVIETGVIITGFDIGRRQGVAVRGSRLFGDFWGRV